MNGSLRDMKTRYWVIIYILFFWFVMSVSYADTTQNNASGSNTSITGGYTNATTYESGVQTFGLGISGGKQFRDKNCERIKLARELSNQGMKVASVSLLCQDERVFQAMHHAGTPCPFEGQIGNKATQAWKKYDKLRPDYKLYVKELKIIEEANAQANSIIIDPVIDNSKK